MIKLVGAFEVKGRAEIDILEMDWKGYGDPGKKH